VPFNIGENNYFGLLAPVAGWRSATAPGRHVRADLAEQGVFVSFCALKKKK
jgi:hypothetical protein